MRVVPSLALLLFSAAPLFAHDTWIQVDDALVRTKDAAFVHLMLGNHGNAHRDFKLASKISPEGWTLAVTDPSGTTSDVKATIVDIGSTPKEGFWTTRFVTREAGLHLVHHTLDKLHGPTRAVKSAKSFVLVSDSLDRLKENRLDFRRPLGAPIELIPLTDPVKEACVGLPIRVKLLYQGNPLANARVSFIPRGATLKEGFDDEFERKTTSEGTAEFTPLQSGWVLVVVHHLEPDQKGEGYEKTHYSATLTVSVPESPRGVPVTTPGSR